MGNSAILLRQWLYNLDQALQQFQSLCILSFYFSNSLICIIQQMSFNLNPYLDDDTQLISSPPKRDRLSLKFSSKLSLIRKEKSTLAEQRKALAKHLLTERRQRHQKLQQSYQQQVDRLGAMSQSQATHIIAYIKQEYAEEGQVIEVNDVESIQERSDNERIKQIEEDRSRVEREKAEVERKVKEAERMAEVKEQEIKREADKIEEKTALLSEKKKEIEKLKVQLQEEKGQQKVKQEEEKKKVEEERKQAAQQIAPQPAKPNPIPDFMPGLIAGAAAQSSNVAVPNGKYPHRVDIQQLAQTHKALAKSFEATFAWSKQMSNQNLDTQPIASLGGATLRKIANSLISQKILPPTLAEFENLGPQDIQRIVAREVDAKVKIIIDGFKRINLATQNPDMVRLLAFRIGRELFQKEAFDYKISQKFTEEEYQRKVVDFYLAIMSKSEEHMPALGFRELFIGYIMSRSTLFYPEYPQDDPSNRPRQIFQLGYNLRELQTREGDLTDVAGINGRLTRCLKIFIHIMKHPSSLGGLLQYLSAHLTFRIHQLSPFIVFYILDIAGKELKRAYPQPMRDILTFIRDPANGFLKRVTIYFDSGAVENEPQNHKDVLSGSSDLKSEIKESKEFVAKLKSVCEAL